MKLWMVKFYIKEIHTYNKPTYRSFMGGLKTELKTETEITEIREKEIHRYLVDSEEKADFLVECFSNGLLKAEKIELVG